MVLKTPKGLSNDSLHLLPLFALVSKPPEKRQLHKSLPSSKPPKKNSPWATDKIQPGNVDPGLITPCLLIWGCSPPKVLKPGTLGPILLNRVYESGVNITHILCPEPAQNAKNHKGCLSIYAGNAVCLTFYPNRRLENEAFLLCRKSRKLDGLIPFAAEKGQPVRSLVGGTAQKSSQGLLGEMCPPKRGCNPTIQGCPPPPPIHRSFRKPGFPRGVLMVFSKKDPWKGWGVLPLETHPSTKLQAPLLSTLL